MFMRVETRTFHELRLLPSIKTGLISFAGVDGFDRFENLEVSCLFQVTRMRGALNEVPH